jgi:hypothetical protein
MRQITISKSLDDVHAAEELFTRAAANYAVFNNLPNAFNSNKILYGQLFGISNIGELV